MPTIKDHNRETLYEGEQKVLDVDVDFELTVLHTGGMDLGVDVIERLDKAVKREMQAIQDELDED